MFTFFFKSTDLLPSIILHITSMTHTSQEIVGWMISQLSFFLFSFLATRHVVS